MQASSPQTATTSWPASLPRLRCDRLCITLHACLVRPGAQPFIHPPSLAPFVTPSPPPHTHTHNTRATLPTIQRTDTSEFTSSVGSAGYEARRDTVNEGRAIATSWLGTKDDSTTTLTPYATEVAVSAAAQEPATLTGTTSLASFSRSATRGGFWPGAGRR